MKVQALALCRPIYVSCLFAFACSTDDATQGPRSRQQPTGSSTGTSGSGTNAGAAGSGFGNSGTPTGSTPLQPTGSGTMGSDATPGLATGEECAGFDAQAQNGSQPADIIIAVDQSSSMNVEVVFVQEQLNAFSKRIIDAMVDVHVILIVEKPGGAFVENPVCIPPPLAGPNCADNEPIFKHVNQHVDSDDAWDQIIATYSQYQHLLRPGAQKHVVVISDDAPRLSRTAFDQMLKALSPQFEGYRHHAIYGFTYPGQAPFCSPPGDVCCGLADGDGSEYGRLTDETGGIKGNLCLQDFEPVWSELATQVIENTTLACDWEIPAPPPGQMLDPLRVNVHYSGDGVAPQLIGWAASPGDCGTGDGWYYDNNTQPTRVFACPHTCATIQGLANARIDIKYGCGRCAGLDADCGESAPPAPPSVD